MAPASSETLNPSEPHEDPSGERIVDPFETARLVVEVAQIVPHDGDEPDAPADLCHADVLSREDRTEIHLLALETDPPP